MFWLGTVSCLAVCNQDDLKIQIFNQAEKLFRRGISSERSLELWAQVVSIQEGGRFCEFPLKGLLKVLTEHIHHAPPELQVLS